MLKLYEGHNKILLTWKDKKKKEEVKEDLIKDARGG